MRPLRYKIRFRSKGGMACCAGELIALMCFFFPKLFVFSDAEGFNCSVVIMEILLCMVVSSPVV